MTKRNGVISCSLFLLLTITFDNAAAKHPQKSAEVSGIYLDVLKVSACAARQGCSTVGGPKQWNLFDLAEGKTDFANQVLMPAKTNELRLILGQKSTITVDGTSYPLSVPSGQASGLKLKGNKISARTSGFLKNLKLDFDLDKGLVVQAKKSKENDKKGGETVIYSYSLKPVIHVSAAEITPMSENMAGVFVMPNESSKLKLGNDFLLTIPVGAVSEPTLITSVPRSFYIKLANPTTGKISTIPPLSSIYYLSPSGLTFNKPVAARLHYDEAAIPKGVTEDDLIIYHDGNPISSDIDKNKNIITTQITHFSALSIDVDIDNFCALQPAVVDFYGNAIAGISHILCPNFISTDQEGNNVDLPDFHLIEGDRKLLAEKYRMDVISVDSETGGLETHSVSELADWKNAIVAINGNHFGCIPYGGDRCYEQGGGAGMADRIHIEDGKVKGKNNSKNVVFAFGGSSTSLIPIERLKTSGVIEENNSDRVFEDVFSQQFNIGWKEAGIGKKIQVANGILNSAIGEKSTILYTVNNSTECKYPTAELPDDDSWPAFGYGESKVLFLASDKNGNAPDWQYFSQICLVLRAKQAENAMLLDGGGSTQLAARRISPSVPGRSEVVTVNNNNEGLRLVANAIGLVPKDQPRNGNYCGQKSLGQDSNALYSYANGKYTIYRKCVHGCNQDTNTCKSILPACPLTNGLYCGNSPSVAQLSLDSNTLYNCENGAFWVDKQCANGCEVMGTGVNDECRSCKFGTGYYCGSIYPSLDGNTLYYCQQDGVFSVDKQCANGCEKNDDGKDDQCKSEEFVKTMDGRVWQRYDDGNTYILDEAEDYCNNLVLGGFSDWRLPTNDELRNLVVCTNGTKTPLAVYPDDPAVPYSCDSHNSASYVTPTISSDFVCKAEPYWSSSLYQNTSYALTVDFYHGWSSKENPTTNKFYVRCVR